MKSNLIYFILFSLSLLSCSSDNKTESDSPISGTRTNQVKSISKIDTSNIAILKFDQTGNWLFNNSYKPTLLYTNEIIQIDSLIKSCVKKHNSELDKEGKKAYSIDFEKFSYKLQYIPVLNSNGEKEVWINGFCSSFGNWKKEVIATKDGGNCYFNLKINLSSGNCYEINVNEDV